MSSDYLEILIEEHHNLYINLFGDLKPKHHFLVHYPNLMRKIGPLKYVSSMRYEARHRQLKINASVVKSRVNMPVTLSIKNQLSFYHRVSYNINSELMFVFGKRTELTNADTKLIEKMLPEKKLLFI